MNEAGSRGFRRSKLNGAIDYASLKAELEQALTADRFYRLRNDAKLRAVEQNVPTYDDFRQMVNAAHLRPLRRDQLSLRAKGYWNPIAAGHESEPETDYVEFRQERTETRKPDDLIADNSALACDQFTRAWRTIEDRQAKFRYLESFKDALETKIFPTEIPPALFAELIEVCSETVAATSGTVETVVQILSVLRKCNRFGLTVSFMGEKERTACNQLFRRLIDSAKHGNRHLEHAIESLKSAYKVTPN
ncbi:dynein axonemal assembly factor 19 [Nomia melanderi]|uniref:dynein axonemal assembly factor 19 n=1 Tax=Nomia melanderi TaxID=2448451 RepID=UPI001304233C|nr:coiled-coil domain-containing protein 103 [Nomia melanderi]